MNKSTFNILVTGVGAVIGQGVIKSLKIASKGSKQFNIVGLDKNPDSAGRSWCDNFFHKPEVSEDSIKYLNFWKDLLVKESIDLVIPGIEEDVFFLSENRKVLSKMSILQLNSNQIVNLCKDKWKTYQFLKSTDVEVIPTLKLENTWYSVRKYLGDLPFLIKPRRGNGSRGIHIIDKKKDFIYWKSKLRSNSMIIQKYIQGVEFTVSSFGFDEDFLKPFIFRRKLNNTGSTQWAQIEENSDIDVSIKKIFEKINFQGPTNFQFILDCSKLFLLEINPRISSSTSMRAQFGYNESLYCVDHYLKKKKIEVSCLKKGKVVRFYEDQVI